MSGLRNRNEIYVRKYITYIVQVLIPTRTILVLTYVVYGIDRCDKCMSLRKPINELNCSSAKNWSVKGRWRGS